MCCNPGLGILFRPWTSAQSHGRPSQPPQVERRARPIFAPHTRLALRDMAATPPMMQSTRRWLRRNRAHFAIGAGVLGAGYLAGQYVLGKLGETRQRMSDERIAKEKYGVPPATA